LTKKEEKKQMIIREFKIADFEAAELLWKNTDGVCNCEACQFLHTRERLEKFFARNPGLCFVAVEGDGTMVGTVLCGHDGRTGMIYRLTVSQSHRKMGIGRQLVEKAVKALEAEGTTIAKAYVLNGNDGGNEFWEKIGFTVFDRAVTREYVIYDGK
jgi:ribosomal protein S18 acetylase RimI-like enzyme